LKERYVFKERIQPFGYWDIRYIYYIIGRSLVVFNGANLIDNVGQDLEGTCPWSDKSYFFPRYIVVWIPLSRMEGFTLKVS